MKLRFSLRTLSIVIAIICVILLAPLAMQIHRGGIHKSVESRLRDARDNHEIDGHIEIQFGIEVLGTSRAAPAAEWLETIGIEQSVERIHSITISRCDTHDVNLIFDQLSRLDSISVLQVDECSITADQLKYLVKNTEVRSLFIHELDAPGGRIPFLRDTRLEYLSIYNSNLANGFIQDLPLSLKYLHLARCPLDDTNLLDMPRLRNLDTFSCCWTKMTVNGLKQLQQDMPDLHIDPMMTDPYWLRENSKVNEQENPSP